MNFDINYKPVYSVVIPVYNEEEVIHSSYEELKRVMDLTNEDYELIFVNDGSKDKSIDMLREFAKNDRNVKVIDFARNFGHQIAITAGMDYAIGEAIVVIDADLQDPPMVILQMIEKWKEGYEVVYGKRLKRDGETFFKKFTAKVYYRFLKAITNIDIPTDTGDFRLIDRKVASTMTEIREKNRYIRGLISWVGYKQTAVLYDRHERFAGETKYSLKKMVKLASDGVISFSNFPLKLPAYLGSFLMFFSFLYLIVIIVMNFTGDKIVFLHYGLFLLFFLQGVILLFMGIMGEYISRIFDEVRDRPLYLISKITQGGCNEDEENN